MSKKAVSKAQVRCLNCFVRFAPPHGQSQARCPNCGVEWRVTWTSGNSVKIRGPVWSQVKGGA